MALTNSWPGVNGAATTTDARKNLAGLLAKDTAGVARAGVFPAHTNALVASRTDMNVDIAAFTGVAVQFGGPVLIANDGVAQLPSVLVSPGAGTNYYVIYAKQNESTSPGTDANNNRVFGAQLSTTSLAVARAALPAGALELATVEMPTGKTATNQGGVVITQTHQYTAAAGGTVWVRNATELGEWSPAAGSRTFQMDVGWEYIRTGSGWIAARTVASAYNGTGSAQSINVSAADLTSLAFTLTLPASMNIRLKYGLQVYNDTTAAGVQIDIFDGAASIRTLFHSANSNTSAGTSNTIFGEALLVGLSSGSHQLKLRATRLNTGTITFPHPAAYPSWFLAETF